MTSPDKKGLGQCNPVSVGLSGLSLRERRTVSCGDADKDPRVFRPFQQQFNLQSAIFVPMIYGDRVEGVILVYAHHKNAFDENRVRAVELISGILAAAMAQAAEFEAKQLARDEAQRATRVKTEFLANMSHEIRTPLNGILGMAELLAETNLDSDQRNSIQVILDSGVGLLTILNDILDFSKIEAGKISLETLDFDLLATLRAPAELLQGKAREKGLSLNLETGAENSVWVKGDAVRLGQILLNLLGNAIKFTSQGSVTLKLDRLPARGGRVPIKISVRDTGVGLDPETLGILFTPFTQADGSTARRFGGTGLGLSISKRLVNLMGGEIGVESHQGVGSTFWFSLELEVSMENRAIPTEPERQEARTASGKMILVAEDNAINLVVISRMLKALGHEVRPVANGVEALDAFLRETFDLILMDCQMPEMDGLQASRAIRELEKKSGRHVPIVAVTANAMSEDRRLCLEAGMDAFLTKAPQKRAVGGNRRQFFTAQKASLKHPACDR